MKYHIGIFIRTISIKWKIILKSWKIKRKKEKNNDNVKSRKWSVQQTFKLNVVFIEKFMILVHGKTSDRSLCTTVTNHKPLNLIKKKHKHST
jgi:hypothetical protein